MPLAACPSHRALRLNSTAVVALLPSFSPRCSSQSPPIGGVRPETGYLQVPILIAAGVVEPPCPCAGIVKLTPSTSGHLAIVLPALLALIINSDSLLTASVSVSEVKVHMPSADLTP